MHSVNALKQTGQRRPVALFLLFGGAFCCLIISGCTPPEFYQYRHRATLTAAKDIVPPSAHEPVDLYSLLMGYASEDTFTLDEDFKKNLTKCKATSPTTDGACVYLRGKYLEAVVAFNKKYLGKPKDYAALRNHVQDRLIAASNQRCSAFTANIAQSQANIGFTLGSLATAAGAAGAIVSEAAAKTYAGASAVLSGTRAEFDYAYFNNLFIHQIVIAIEQQREEMLEEILAKREKMDATNHTVDMAIADALNYHGTCNIVTGAIANQDRITRVNNPGAKEFKRAYGEWIGIRAQGFGVDEEKVETFFNSIEEANRNEGVNIQMDPSIKEFLEKSVN